MDGLDKDAILAAERKRAAAESKKTVRLNRPFPGVVIAPPLGFFTGAKSGN